MAGWKYKELNEGLQAAIDLLGVQNWEPAYKDSQYKEYRILRLEGFSREQEHAIQGALDTLIISHAQKPMAPYKGARKAEYVPVIKVFNWRSIDNIVKTAKNPDTTMMEIEDAVRRAAALTCFERVFPDVDDFLSFQAVLDRGDIRDHINGGLLLKLDISNTTIEGLREILARSGLNVNLVEFQYDDGPENVFIPNEAFPENVRPVTIYDESDDATVMRSEEGAENSPENSPEKGFDEVTRQRASEGSDDVTRLRSDNDPDDDVTLLR